MRRRGTRPRACRADARQRLFIRDLSAKKSVGVKTWVFPHSPDLNPLDFFVRSEVDRRMASQEVPANESLDAFKGRMRRTAFAIPKKTVLKAARAMKSRAQAVWEAKCGDIARY